ncbi:hypothetical protein EYZ11_001094 [Aspergillus tanneri]|uniref:aldehyde dehydrogenase (NAD(+)) n=1 Tax=Aspergillus tanneri TaxID=1220188 RepID=A0A4S3JVK0_9EURO|nr:uncharacterized protein ATNIH1004_009708 [Aspergillus tanneri]KAA8642946.1 hypothetical protein ATNIH1004_009708 [Aspergillus tanneri]THC99456.1 hypothetical protein EYZ11_001094 [Aspergillus tanneri]
MTTTENAFPIPTQLFINGEYTDSSSSERVSVYSPVDGSLVTDKLQYAAEDDVNRAVASAQTAFRSKSWAGLTAKERGRALMRIYQVMLAHKEELAWLDRVTMGKPVNSGLAEVQLAADLFEYYAGWTDKHAGDTFPADDGFLKIVQHEPLGVCAGILPWNGPLALIAVKTAPALATGNVMILKPSEKSPLSALRFASLVADILPPGVVQVLTGAGATGELLARHPQIRKISFTGSGLTGKKIQRAAAESNLKRVTLELGGKTPAGIFEDCNLENAVKWAVDAITKNTGQVCIAASRIYVQESIAEEFVDAFVKSMKAAADGIGDPHSADTKYGPLADQAQLARVQSFFTEDAGKTQVLVGGHRHGEKGCFFEPTVLYNPDPQASVYKNEIFGPVACVRTFKDEEDFLQMANDTEYGLNAAVFTKDINRALRISSRLESGTVGVNCVSMLDYQVPFGGSKQSGFGREFGLYGLKSYTEPKSILVK